MKKLVLLCEPEKPITPPPETAMGIEVFYENPMHITQRRMVVLSFLHRGECVQSVRMEARYAITLAEQIAAIAKG